MDLDLIGRGLVDLDLIGRVLIGLGAALVCIGAIFMFRSRAPGTQVEKDGEGVDNEPRMPTRHDNRDPAHQSIGK
jgi:hypothetical protein